MSKLIKGITGFYCGLFGLLLLFAAAAGLFYHVRLEVGIENDRPLFFRQNYLLMAASLIIAALIIYALYMIFLRFPALTGRKMLVLALIAAAAFCGFFLWMVKGLPTNDANMLNDIVNRILDGDMSDVNGTNPSAWWYLGVYPFQITYVCMGEIIGRIFGKDNFLVYQLLNVVSILITILLLYRMSLLMFENSRTARWTAFLCIGLVFFFMYASLIYNDIWSIAPQTGALYFAMLYLRKKRFRDGVFCALCLALAVFFKSNCYIAMIAIEAELAFSLFIPEKKTAADTDPIVSAVGTDRKKNMIRTIVVMILLLVLSKGLTGAVSDFYARRAGMESLPDGTPATAYFAMAMREGDHSYGWYNGYNASVISEFNYDGTAAGKQAVEDWKESIRYFASHPRYAAKFYLLKFLSQWEDPTCCSMREYELTARHQEGLQPEILQYFLFGKGAEILDHGMNVYHMVIYLLTAAFVIMNIRKAPGRCTCLVMLFILGGMLFHQLWEGSSRYVMRYYIAMVPLAAQGLEELLEVLTKRGPSLYHNSQSKTGLNK